MEDLEEKLSAKADRQTESGGFQAGAATTVGNTGATEGGAIGKNAKETNGGFAGGAGANASYSYGNLGNSYFIILFFYRCLLVKQTNSRKVL